MSTVRVKYVGRKARFTDHLYGTGLVWKPDQVLGVPAEAAARMKKHPDVWELLGDVDDATVPYKAPVRKQEPEFPVPLVTIDAMNVEQLRDYAQRYFNFQIDGRYAVERARDAVRTLIQGERIKAAQ